MIVNWHTSLIVWTLHWSLKCSCVVKLHFLFVCSWFWFYVWQLCTILIFATQFQKLLWFFFQTIVCSSLVAFKELDCERKCLKRLQVILEKVSSVNLREATTCNFQKPENPVLQTKLAWLSHWKMELLHIFDITFSEPLYLLILPFDCTSFGV